MSGITIRGDEQLLRAFDNINDFDEWATPPMRKGGEALLAIVRRYAPERSGSSYVRTGTYGRSVDLDVDSSPSGVTVHVFSYGANQGRGDYEDVLKVEGFQAEIHQGRWPTDKDDLAESEPVFMDEMEKAAAELLR